MTKKYSTRRLKKNYLIQQSNAFDRSKSPSIQNPMSNQFTAKTFRNMFFFLLISGIGGIITIFFPLSILAVQIIACLLLISMVTFLVLTYGFKSHSKALFFFLIFTILSGALLGPLFSIIALSIQNGLFIISSAIAVVLSMVFMLHNYAIFKDFFNLEKISLIGTFLTSSLSGLSALLIVSLIITTPINAFLVGLSIVGFFSLYFTYSVYRLKTSSYTQPIEAAMKLSFDIPHFILDTFLFFGALLTITKKSCWEFMGYFFINRIVPIFGIILVILSVGYLEEWLIGPQPSINESVNSPEIPLFNTAEVAFVRTFLATNTQTLTQMNQNTRGKSGQVPITPLLSQNNQRFFVNNTEVREYLIPPKREDYNERFLTGESRPSAPPEHAFMV